MANNDKALHEIVGQIRNTVRNNMSNAGLSLGQTDLARAQNGSTVPQQPTMSAQEVQDTVNQNAAANAATALPANGQMMLNGMGMAGGRTAIVPGSTAYNNVYSGPMEQIMNGLLNQKPFSYDVNADGLYQQIKDNYIKQGRQAMMNTQGQAAALTGGYGNSYAAQAGQQAYQESLGNLQGMIPELQQLAFQQYQQEQNDKRNNLEALNKLESQEYARWLDEQQLRLDLYKNFPELMQTGVPNIEGNIVVQGGGASAKDIAEQLARQGMTGANAAFAVDPNIQMALAEYLKKTGGDINSLYNMRKNGISMTGAPDAQVDYFVNTAMGMTPTNPNYLNGNKTVGVNTRTVKPAGTVNYGGSGTNTDFRLFGNKNAQDVQGNGGNQNGWDSIKSNLVKLRNKIVPNKVD